MRGCPPKPPSARRNPKKVGADLTVIAEEWAKRYLAERQKNL